MVGCPGTQTTTIIYLRTICLRINLRLNNIFCCLSNFAFLSTLIIKSSNHKSVSGHLWYSYTSLSILNVLLTSLYFFPSLVVLFEASTHVTFPQFHHSLFLPTLHSRYNIPFLSYSDIFCTIAFFLLHFTHFTLVILFLLASPSLQSHISWNMPYCMFFIYLSRKKPCLQFSWVYTPLLLYLP